MGTGGASQNQKNAKLEKIGGPLNSLAPFLSIWLENWSQDGRQNPTKVDKKSDQDLFIFSNGFLKHFGSDLGAKMDEKSVQKRSQKHVGSALEVK